MKIFFVKKILKYISEKQSDLYTVWLKWIAHFAVGILLLHNYKSDLVHISDLYSLVIGIYISER